MIVGCTFLENWKMLKISVCSIFNNEHLLSMKWLKCFYLLPHDGCLFFNLKEKFYRVGPLSNWQLHSFHEHWITWNYDSNPMKALSVLKCHEEFWNVFKKVRNLFLYKELLPARFVLDSYHARFLFKLKLHVLFLQIHTIEEIQIKLKFSSSKLQPRQWRIPFALKFTYFCIFFNATKTWHLAQSYATTKITLCVFIIINSWTEVIKIIDIKNLSSATFNQESSRQQERPCWLHNYFKAPAKQSNIIQHHVEQACLTV